MSPVALPTPARLPTQRLAMLADVELVREANHPEVFDEPADIGAWIVQRLATHARSLGLVPTAGCGVDKPASRRTLERAGVVADPQRAP